MCKLDGVNRHHRDIYLAVIRSDARGSLHTGDYLMLPISDITKTGTYDSTNNIAYPGTPMPFSENIGFAEGLYYGTAWVYANICKGSQSFPLPGKPWSSGNRSSGAVHLGNGFYDTTGGETWNPLVIGGSPLDPYLPQGRWILRWVGSATVAWNADTYAWCTEFGSQTNNLIAGQTHSDFDGVGANGTFAGGSGHAVDDVITFVSGATATVDAVGASNAVTQFTIDKTGDYNDDHGGGVATGDDGTQVAATADNQSSTTGTGTGFNLTPGVNNILHRRYYDTNTTAWSNGNNVTTTNGTCTRLELLQPGNETSYDQGNIVALQTVTDLSGFDVLRFMGITGTNNSPYRYHSEYPAYEDYSWYFATPVKAIAKFCNECNAQPWVNVPHQYDATEQATYLQELYDNLNPGNRTVWLEYSNETWNSGGAFKEQFSWTTRGDVTDQEGTITLSTSNVNSTAHGLTTGDPIIFYKTDEHINEPSGIQRFSAITAVNPYYAVVDDANNFRIAMTSGMASRGNDVTTTSDADYDDQSDTNVDPNSAFVNMSTMRWKTDTAVKDQRVNHAELSVALWDEGDTIFGRSNCKHIAMGQRGVTSITESHMAVQDFRENVDHTGIACYWRFLDLSGAGRSMPALTIVVDAQDETNYDGTSKVRDAQDETDYDEDPEVEGRMETPSGQSGYDALDTIELGWSFTVDTSTDELSTTGADSLKNDAVVQLSTTGTLLAPLATATNYYVINVDTANNELELATTQGGAAINITTTGTGTHYIEAGITITVDAVSSGEVTEFTVDATSAADSGTIDTIMVQASTSGTGTGFQLRTRGYNILFNGTFDGGSGHAVSDVIRLGYEFTADTSTNRLNGLGELTEDGLAPGSMVSFNTTGTLPAPLVAGTNYMVVERNPGNYITVAEMEDWYREEVIDITDTGTGQHYLRGYIDVTVDAVDGGGTVTQFTIDSTNDQGGHEPGHPIPQISTTGTGTLFELTPEAANISTSATVEDAYQYMLEQTITEVMGQQRKIINASGRAITINYEGFDHQGSAAWSYNIPSIGALVELWGRSSQRTLFVQRWCRELSLRNIRLCCHHSFVAEIDYSGAWPLMEHQGDSDAAENVGMRNFLDVDGAPKI